MASKGPRSKLDHETRAKRQKALEAPREPPRPRTHWDHVLEEMVWLSKDFESERKWKLAQAKKVAFRASKGMLDHASRGEKKMKEEEQRLRKVATNISKDVKKFWVKIEKLVLYKHQMELDEKKKKALDKQLEFLLGQTERYSTMLAENLVDKQDRRCELDRRNCKHEEIDNHEVNGDGTIADGLHSDALDEDDDYHKQSDEQSEDDEHTIEKDEALITEKERQEELVALHDEADLPIEELLKRYCQEEAVGDKESTPEKGVEQLEVTLDMEDHCLGKDHSAVNKIEQTSGSPTNSGRRCAEIDGISQNKSECDINEPLSSTQRDLVNVGGTENASTISEETTKDPLTCDFNDEQGEVDCIDKIIIEGGSSETLSSTQRDLVNVGGTENISTISEETTKYPLPCDLYDEQGEVDGIDQNKSEGDINETLSLMQGDLVNVSGTGNISTIAEETSKDLLPCDLNDEQEDADFVLTMGDEKDDEATLSEEEKLAEADPDDPEDEIQLLQKESEIPLEELLARYRKEANGEVSGDDMGYASAFSEDFLDSDDHEDIELKKHESLSENAESGVCPHLAGQGVETEETSDERENEKRIADAAAAARSAQPTGNTFLTTKVRTKFPFLLKYPLREYQHIGLDWLVTMYEKRLNGILADEMGLGKTIMTIALLAHLACEKGIWGPHLIVVPTSVMLNWETEFLKWCPAFKILTYFGSAKERKLKRQGWLKLNSFHVCITTYRLVIQDCKVFKRKKWKYLILDEAHLIKNWKSQRWQTLLNFNSKRRILLTGTPLQNDLMELWSLMHFLMPHIFQSHQEFKDWFSNPISGMVEGQERVNKEVVDRLHNVLRPFILRRLKRDVEKQLPMKHEHVIYCRLSRRQRNLYEDFISSSETQATLASSNFFGMISVIMQLRKVCNHPDLFEGRPIISSFDMAGMDAQLSSSICSVLSCGPFSTVNLSEMGLIFTHLDYGMTSWEHEEVTNLATPSALVKERANLDSSGVTGFNHQKVSGTNIFEQVRKAILEERLREVKERAASVAWWNSLRCHRKPIYSLNLRKLVTIKRPVDEILAQKVDQRTYMFSSKLADIVLSPVERFEAMIDLVESFIFAIPAARAPEPACWCSRPAASVFLHPTYKEKCSEVLLPLLAPIRPAIVRRQVYFPDRRLVQFDCGKLQELAVLLRKLKSEGHRALIFTQMTKMLDILEAFINLYGYTYMRLDGSTQPEERQTLMQRFNTNPKIFLFILSTRSGGVGINLVGADTVIFYDSDWNPAMDQQAQDRCHRIGQTREVHIYRLISESTIEENILRKAKQKRALDDLVIQSGSYNTEFFKKLDPMELFSGHESLHIKDVEETCVNNEDEMIVSNAEVEAALKYAEDEADYMALKRVEQEEAVENQEFTEDAMGRLEDDECVNDEDTKADEPADQEMAIAIIDSLSNLNRNESIEDRVLKFAGSEDDADMLADVREIAEAAAAAGQAISSFENQLRPIDRYAIRFLELWDPVIDKTEIDSHDRFEETEWELERIEKYKEEMEADIDDDEEPFVYESWDADFATKAYREQVEALAQHQLEEELLAEANGKEDEAGLENNAKEATPKSSKPKSKKKPKKAKYKSLKKGSLASEIKQAKEEPSTETVSFDDGGISDGASSLEMTPLSTVDKKRKKGSLAFEAEADKKTKKKLKQLKAQEACHFNVDLDHSGKRHDGHAELRACDRVVPHLELKPSGRSKMGGKVSITSMPVKRILTIKPEKFKKGNIWSRDCVPSPDMWLPQEDAILCAVVHEYGPNWNLVCETLYGLTAGGVYRGRYRHPVHCCERYRELIQRFVLSSPENQNSEKVSSLGSGKGLLKVTEENIRTLLNIAAEQPDHELLLQKHFTALLTSVWRVTSHMDHQKNALSQNLPLLSGKFFRSLNQTSRSCRKELVKRTRFDNSEENKKLLKAALDDANSIGSDAISLPLQSEDIPSVVDRLEVTLEFQTVEGDDLLPLPHAISMFIPGSDSSTSSSEGMEKEHLKSSSSLEEKQFRGRAGVEGSLGLASPALHIDDVKLRPHAKLQSLGKHKLPISDLIKPPKRLKRNSLESDEVNHSNAWPVIQSLPTISSEELDLGSGSIGFHDNWTDCTDANGSPCLDEGLPSEIERFEDIPHQYITGLISGLDDCAIWPEFTDVG